MEAVLGFLEGLGVWTIFTLWALLLLSASMLTYLGLGGNIVITALAVIWGLLTGFNVMTLPFLGLLVGLTVLGEVIESLLGIVYVAKKGATRYGVTGVFLGGLIGAAVGNNVMPVIGALVGSFAGAFLGAVFGEYYREKNIEPSLRIGWHAFFGKMLAIVVKHAIGMVMIWLILKRTWPESLG